MELFDFSFWIGNPVYEEWGVVVRQCQHYIIFGRENGECQNFGRFIWIYFLFENSPMLKRFMYFYFGLYWPTYGHVVQQNMPYYLCIRTYAPIYVPRLSWYVDTYICFIYTYLYQCTTYMYVSDDPYIQVLYWYIHVLMHTYPYIPIGIVYV